MVSTRTALSQELKDSIRNTPIKATVIGRFPEIRLELISFMHNHLGIVLLPYDELSVGNKLVLHYFKSTR